MTDQFGPNSLDALTKVLSEQRPAGVKVVTSNVQTRFFERRVMHAYSIEMRIRRRPFFIEILDTVPDGRPPSVLTPTFNMAEDGELVYGCHLVRRFWSLRLCFRQPEGINRLNAIRLNHFIEYNKAKISSRKVGEIIVSWGQADLVRTNLGKLEKLPKLKIPDQEKILAAIKKAETRTLDSRTA